MGRRFHTRTVPVNAEIQRAFRIGLLRWYRRNQRDLPWRRTRDPYRIWVSEIMLQQTRVKVVADYYRRWLKSFPTVRSLARAPLARVLKHWEGLGYYARARNLHRASRLIVKRWGGQLPRSADELQTIPGIGRYTAGAVASIAFDEPISVLDGNVARVLARVFALRDNVKQPATVKRLYALADALLPGRGAGDFNQALMELGALVCLPQQPRCAVCPLRADCRAHAHGLTATLPRRGDARRPVRLVRDVVYATRQGRLLLRQRPVKGPLAGMWELPAADETPFQIGAPLAEVRHTITHYRIRLRAFVGTGTAETRLPDGRWRWTTVRDRKKLALPAAHRKLLSRIGRTHGAAAKK